MWRDIRAPGRPRAPPRHAAPRSSIPEKENSNPSAIIGRGKLKRVGSPSRANRSISGPPGYARPRSVATLSNASPAASSRVSPSRRYRPQAGTSSSNVWPPETSSATNGGAEIAILDRRRETGALPYGARRSGARIAGKGERLGVDDADEQRAGQAGARRLRRPRRWRRARGLLPRAPDRRPRGSAAEMRPARQLGDDAAKTPCGCPGRE